MNFSNSVKLAIFTLLLVPISLHIGLFRRFSKSYQHLGFRQCKCKKKFDNLKPIAWNDRLTIFANMNKWNFWTELGAHVKRFKGIVSRDWEWLQRVLNYRLEANRLTQYICNAFRRYIHVIIENKHALAVSHLTVTLRMISNSRRPSPVINAHLPIDQAGIFRIKTWKWHQNGEKLCSGNPTFFRSITWNPLYHPVLNLVTLSL
jgi:hypothetical protein